MDAGLSAKISVTNNSIKSTLKSLSDNQAGKACLFNLIIYTCEPRRTDYFAEMVKIIKGQFPCRIIFIQGNPLGKSHSLRITTYKEDATENEKLNTNQIYIEASGPEFNRVYFLLLPLLASDLPIYLLWGQNPTTEYTLLPRLESFASRLIFDAETAADLQQFSREMLVRLNSSSMQISDMNWARIAGWREVFAQIFDSAERFEQLTHVHQISIICNDNPSELFVPPNIQALYFQSWLAARLNWQFLRIEHACDTQTLYYENKQIIRKIVLSHKTDVNFEREEILRFEIQGENGYECAIERLNAKQINVRASNQNQCELPLLFLIPSLRSARSFMQEIFYQKTSDHYAQMLRGLCAVAVD